MKSSGSTSKLELDSNRAIAAGRRQTNLAIDQYNYGAQRQIVGHTLDAQTQLADNVAAIQSTAQGVTLQSSLQAAQLTQQGSVSSAYQSYPGKREASGITYPSQTGVADMRFNLQMQNAATQLQTTLAANRLRQMSQMIQTLGSAASHQLGEAFEKFNRF